MIRIEGEIIGGRGRGRGRGTERGRGRSGRGTERGRGRSGRGTERGRGRSGRGSAGRGSTKYSSNNNMERREEEAKRKEEEEAKRREEEAKSIDKQKKAKESNTSEIEKKTEIEDNKANINNQIFWKKNEDDNDTDSFEIEANPLIFEMISHEWTGKLGNYLKFTNFKEEDDGTYKPIMEFTDPDVEQAVKKYFK